MWFKSTLILASYILIAVLNGVYLHLTVAGRITQSSRAAKWEGLAMFCVLICTKFRLPTMFEFHVEVNWFISCFKFY